MVQPVTLEDLGYRCLGPWPGETPDRAGYIASAAGRFGYDVEQRGAEWFIRRKERRQGVLRADLLERVQSLNSASWTLQGKRLTFLDSYLRSPAARYHSVTGLDLPFLIELLRKLLNRRLSPHRRISEFKKALFFASREQLRPVLTFAFDIFFQVFPAGKILVYATNESYETSQAFLRGSFTMDNVSPDIVKTLQGMGFETLKRWQPTSSFSITDQILSQLDFSFYPHVTGFHGGPFGLHFHFLLDRPFKYKPGIWPRDWLAYPIAAAGFAAEARTMAQQLSEDPQGRVEAAHARYLFRKAPSIDDRLSFEEWVVGQENRLAFELLDVTNFLTDRGARLYVDSDFAFKHFLTMERIRRHTLLNHSLPVSIAAKTQVFTIADLFETIIDQNPKRALDGVMVPTGARGDLTPFKLFFHRSHTISLLSKCFSTLPTSAGKLLREAAMAVHDNLVKTVLESVFIPGARTSSGVNVRGPKSSWLESDEEFVASSMRAYRNTHHGYLSTSKVPSSAYLSLLTGNVTDDIAVLPTIWWYAMLGDPNAFAGIPMTPTGVHPI